MALRLATPPFVSFAYIQKPLLRTCEVLMPDMLLLKQSQASAESPISNTASSKGTRERII